jgi:hypothetical protein
MRPLLRDTRFGFLFATGTNVGAPGERAIAPRLDCIDPTKYLGAAALAEARGEELLPADMPR